MKTHFIAVSVVLATLVTPVVAAKVDTSAQAAKKGAEPAASPGWVVLEEDWWVPNGYLFLDSLQDADAHLRAGEEKAASAELEKAAAWLRYASNFAEKSTQEDLMTAQADLGDFARDMRAGKPIHAKKLRSAFAHASRALAKYHHFKSNQGLAKDDLKTARRHLLLAVDHVRAAAAFANQEYGDDIVDIYDTYAPHGYWDETIVLDENKIESNLDIVNSELERLVKELKTTSK